MLAGRSDRRGDGGEGQQAAKKEHNQDSHGILLLEEIRILSSQVARVDSGRRAEHAAEEAEEPA